MTYSRLLRRWRDTYLSHMFTLLDRASNICLLPKSVGFRVQSLLLSVLQPLRSIHVIQSFFFALSCLTSSRNTAVVSVVKYTDTAFSLTCRMNSLCYTINSCTPRTITSDFLPLMDSFNFWRWIRHPVSNGILHLVVKEFRTDGNGWWF